MEVLAANYLYEKIFQDNEAFATKKKAATPSKTTTGTTTTTKTEASTGTAIMGIVALIFALLCVFVFPQWAAGESWRCSTEQGHWFITKLFFAFWALVFAPLYLIIRAIFGSWLGCGPLI
jgi:uncharacterized BrkB/YihY/UPF0761 family membrane protein